MTESGERDIEDTAWGLESPQAELLLAAVEGTPRKRIEGIIAHGGGPDDLGHLLRSVAALYHLNVVVGGADPENLQVLGDVLDALVGGASRAHIAEAMGTHDPDDVSAFLARVAEPTRALDRRIGINRVHDDVDAASVALIERLELPDSRLMTVVGTIVDTIAPVAYGPDPGSRVAARRVVMRAHFSASAAAPRHYVSSRLTNPVFQRWRDNYRLWLATRTEDADEPAVIREYAAALLGTNSENVRTFRQLLRTTGLTEEQLAPRLVEHFELFLREIVAAGIGSANRSGAGDQTESILGTMSRHPGILNSLAAQLLGPRVPAEVKAAAITSFVNNLPERHDGVTLEIILGAAIRGADYKGIIVALVAEGLAPNITAATKLYRQTVKELEAAAKEGMSTALEVWPTLPSVYQELTSRQAIRGVLDRAIGQPEARRAVYGHLVGETQQRQLLASGLQDMRVAFLTFNAALTSEQRSSPQYTTMLRLMSRLLGLSGDQPVSLVDFLGGSGSVERRQKATDIIAQICRRMLWHQLRSDEIARQRYFAQLYASYPER